jgi:hypothetical protein
MTAQKRKQKKERQFKLEFKLISTEEEEKSNYANVTFETNVTIRKCSQI